MNFVPRPAVHVNFDFFASASFGSKLLLTFLLPREKRELDRLSPFCTESLAIKLEVGGDCQDEWCHVTLALVSARLFVPNDGNGPGSETSLCILSGHGEKDAKDELQPRPQAPRHLTSVLELANNHVKLPGMAEGL